MRLTAKKMAKATAGDITTAPAMDNPRFHQSHAAKAAVHGMITDGAATRVMTRKACLTAGVWCLSTQFRIGSSNGPAS
jgi:hypothetical protein